jgi:hypothetical protein
MMTQGWSTAIALRAISCLLDVSGTSHKMNIKHGKGEQFQGKYKKNTRKGQNTF